MIEAGSWAGETHLQKSVYFGQEIGGLPTSFGFVLYKHGPYSFQLHDALTTMRVDGLLTVVPKDPYGPSFKLGSNSARAIRRFPKTLRTHRKILEFVSKTLSVRGVAELERLATALFVYRDDEKASVEDRVTAIVDLKPHISRESAMTAVSEVDAIVSEWTAD
ncbi:MAG: hypothetical protein O3C10_09675 [Chloroflexi bacterium]|nr:hypothetical protein [Chloroflexota bacterium]